MIEDRLHQRIHVDAREAAARVGDVIILVVTIDDGHCRRPHEAQQGVDRKSAAGELHGVVLRQCHDAGDMRRRHAGAVERLG